MNQPRIGIGLAGLGHWGPNLARNFAALGALVAICDGDETRCRAVADKHPEATAHARFEALLGDPSVSAVAIATPAVTHASLARQALEAGKHVFVEKPLALDVAEAEALASQADAAGLVLMVGHLLLYHPAYEAMRQVVADGGIGELRYLYSHRLSLGKIRREENALWSFAPHDISMILGLVGDMPVRVTAHGGAYLSAAVADTSLSHMTFPGGVQAHVFVSWLHPFKEHRMVAVGSRGMVVFDDVRTGAEKLLLYPHAVGWQDSVPTIDRADARPLPYGREEPLAVECAHFIESIRRGSRPRSDAREAVRVLRVLSACQASLSSTAPAGLQDSAR